MVSGHLTLALLETKALSCCFQQSSLHRALYSPKRRRFQQFVKCPNICSGPSGTELTTNGGSFLVFHRLQFLEKREKNQKVMKDRSMHSAPGLKRPHAVFNNIKLCIRSQCFPKPCGTTGVELMSFMKTMLLIVKRFTVCWNCSSPWEVVI